MVSYAIYTANTNTYACNHIIQHEPFVLHLQCNLSISCTFLTTGSCVDFLEAWLNLAEKLVNAPAILDSSHALPVPPPSQNEGRRLIFNPLFNPLGFVIRAQKVCVLYLFTCYRITGNIGRHLF